MEDVIYAQPETMEEVYQQQEAAIDIAKKDNDEPMIIVWDSVASSPTKAELEGEYGDSVMGQHARLMSQGLRKIKGKIKRCNIMAVYINQTREKIGVTFGDKSNTFGGKALKFYATVRIEVTMIGKLKKNDGADPHGIAVRAVVKKNKVAPPFKKAEFEIFFDDTGIDHIGATLDWLKQHELIGGSQGWYEIKGKNYRRDEARDLLYRDEELLKEIRNLAYSVSAPK